MASYNEHFKLSVKEIDLIESAIRNQISSLALTETFFQSPDSISNHCKIIELMEVLGALHNQKIWYGQTRHTGIPLG